MTRHVETVMWIVLATLAMLYAVHRYSWPDRYLAALDRDGYVVTRIVGTDCVVVVARDRDGDEVSAWACSR